jgi:hypothetical protein
LSEFAGGGMLHNNVIIKLVAHQQRRTNPTDNSLQMLDANIEILGATPMLFFIQHRISTLLLFLTEQPSSLEKSNSPTVATLQQMLHLVSNVFLLQCLHHLCSASFSRMG